MNKWIWNCSPFQRSDVFLCTILIIVYRFKDIIAIILSNFYKVLIEFGIVSPLHFDKYMVLDKVTEQVNFKPIRRNQTYNVADNNLLQWMDKRSGLLTAPEKIWRCLTCLFVSSPNHRIKKINETTFPICWALRLTNLKKEMLMITLKT